MKKTIPGIPLLKKKLSPVKFMLAAAAITVPYVSSLVKNYVP